MRAIQVLLALVASTACTSRNPAFCGDGTCVDPERPFCDTDGVFGGNPNECIALECTPLEFVTCREQQEVRCDASGSDLQVTECPLGCDASAGGCRECVDNTQCSTTKPICDLTTHSCKACVVDDDCDSRVCDQDAGQCVDENSIVYASAENSFGTCSLSQPCPLQQAVTLATNSAVTRTLRMLPGTYTSSLEVRAPSTSQLQIVGTGATIAVIGDKAAIVVTRGANAAIRDLISTSEKAVLCGEPNVGRSSLLLARSSLTAIGSSGTQIEVERCDLTLSRVEMSLGQQDMLGTRDDATFVADRLHARAIGGGGTTMIFAGQRMNVRVTNSLLEDLLMISFNSDAGPPGSHIEFAFDTMAMRNSTSLCASSAPFVTIKFENDIIVAPGGTNGSNPFTNPTAANCSFVGTLMTRQANPPSGVVIGDPMFADPGNRDFHLVSGSPAVDAAIPATIAAGIDLDGIARPQGGSSDLGAYELPE